MQKFLVGGAVRDELLGKSPKDFDYSVVLEQDIDLFIGRPDGSFDLFESMKANLIREGFRIFLETPEHFTIRAQFPKDSGKRLTADFVLARREGPYSDGRHPDWVQAGALNHDLARRDFTMNAIAKNSDGAFIDMHGGMMDIKNQIIRAVGDPKERMMEDSLRVLRALRFKIQLGFQLSSDLEDMLFDTDVLLALRNISDERKMDELNKAFRANSLQTIRELNHYHRLGDIVFAGRVNLEATMKQKGFRK